MTPIDLVLMRHGQSAGNEANALSRNGDHSRFNPEFRALLPENFPLTSQGQIQAFKAGQWLRKHGLSQFERLIVSPYLRARQTAKILNLEGTWEINPNFRERSIGQMGRPMPEPERWQQHATELEDRSRRRNEGGISLLDWLPEGGETSRDVRERASTALERILSEGNDEEPHKSCLVVSHMEVMFALRAYLEEMSDLAYCQSIVKDGATSLRLNNCGIFHYTRRSPFSGTISNRYSWMRSICPLTDENPAWRDF
jgi:broad specificity phosphatase PhoE